MSGEKPKRYEDDAEDEQSRPDAAPKAEGHRTIAQIMQSHRKACGEGGDVEGEENGEPEETAEETEDEEEDRIAALNATGVTNAYNVAGRERKIMQGLFRSADKRNKDGEEDK